MSDKEIQSKEDWTLIMRIKTFGPRAVFFVSKDDNLNKAHIGHLESKLITMATEAKRCLLDNQNCPALPSMSEMDVADAEGFLEDPSMPSGIGNKRI